MNSVLCPYCGKENDSRSYYCYYCRKQIKEFNDKKKFGYRHNYFYNLKCVVEDSEPVVHVNGYTPYHSKVVEKRKSEKGK